MKTRLQLTLLFLFLLLLIFPVSGSLAQDFPDVCQSGENVLPNCNFDQGLNGWQPFLETGSADLSVLQGGGGCHAPLCPAAYIVTQDHFIGGIYQQVAVQKGVNYYANIVWLVFDTLANDQGINDAMGGGIGRKIGIDPFGGTDSTSPNVVWSQDNWRNDCKICNVEQVTVTAQADTITVFLRLDDTWRLRAAERGFNVPPSKDQFWIDDIGLKAAGGEAIPVEAPTDTPAPQPTDTPAPEATNTPPPPEATAAPTVESAATESADTPTPEPTATPATPPTATPLPPPTLTPTTTPSPTLSPTPRPTRTPTRTPPPQTTAPDSEPDGSTFWLEVAGSTVCLVGLALAVLVAVVVGAVYLYRAGWGQAGDDDEI